MRKLIVVLIAVFSVIAFSCSSDNAPNAPAPKAPTITGFSVPAKVVGDLPFALTAPSSNSTGTFTYTSSNPAVATIAGNTVTIIGAGTSVIKATQAANGSYTSGETTASLVVTAAGPPAGLRTLYVAPTGNDSNNGSLSQPFLTINKAAQVAIAGDVIIIKSGTYKPTSSIVVSNSGTASAPITFFAEVKDGVIIDGSASSTPNATDRQGLFNIIGTTNTTDKGWIIVDGLRVINSVWAGIFTRYSNNIVIKNCSTNNTGASGIIAATASNIKVLNNKVQLACMYPSSAQGTNECITMASVNTFEVAYNTVSDRLTDPSNGGEGIDAKNNCTNGTIHHNTITNLIRIGIYVDAYSGNLSNIEVYNNKIYNTKNGGITVASEQGGAVDGVKIHDNLIYDADKCGIRIAGYLNNGPLKNLDVYQNTVVNCGINAGNWENVGLLIEATNAANTGFTIRNNIFSSCPVQIRGNNQTFSYVLDNNIIFGTTLISGTNAITTDPKFKNPGAKEFSLAVGSPAIDKAVGTPLSTKDFNDMLRDSKPDIGAIEYK
jgi:hypothetical protein